MPPPQPEYGQPHNPTESAVPQPGLIVVGIGASAGGLEATTQLIEAWPPDPNLAFILVQHSDPSSVSMMAALLSPHTALKVVEAADGMPIEPSHLYVIPPGQYLAADTGMLRLSQPPARPSVRMPFDFLLHSLAEQYGERAVCVVLSGTGTDGSAGLASIKERGGLIAVQDPAEAGYGGMPRSAIGTRMADLVLPIAEIPAALRALRARVAPPRDASPPARRRASVDLSGVIELLRSRTANDFTVYKPGTLHRRIVRDDSVFDTLERTTIPALVGSHPEGQPLRVWVVGRSTGEEPYSLTMLILEQIEASGRPIRLQVFASDADADAIAVARDGVYPASIEESVTKARLARFFVREESSWRVAPDLRSAIVFTVQDVLSDPPFSRLDMVSCRNLLIYLRPDAQARVIDAFYFALRDGGVLLLGSAETVVAPDGRFETVAKAERIYHRIGPGLPAQPGPPARFALVRPGEDRRPRTPITQTAVVRPAALAELGRRLVIEAYAPASVLVDPANAVVFSLGPTDRFLRLPPGHATQNLLSMARPGLRATLRTALQAARESSAKVTASGWIAGDGASQRFTLAVHPILEAARKLLLVCFFDADADEDSIAPANVATPHIAELQRELDATRTELQGTVRDLEISAEEQRAIHEEALSVNEEYQSTNEELVASKEELQSLNEELTAVNSQLQETLDRQRTTSDDLQNVLFSTNVATLFLDLEGRIRFFTPAIKALFAVVASDVGRKLADFAGLAPDAALTSDIEAVQKGLEPPDREIEAGAGLWFRRRIRPYRAGRGRVEGVVITFSDVTARKAAGRALEAAKLEAETANATKSRFLAAASHDLRQPLQTLVLLQSLLAASATGEEAQRLVARQADVLGTVSGMLDTLLDINEIEAGAVRPDTSVFAIGGLMERLRDEFTYHAQAKGVVLTVVPCAQRVRSDMRLLEQIVRNLLSNAIKYTKNGRILLGCRRYGESLRLEVWDTGIGMDKSALASIFEEYFQVANAARQRSRGLGLGLSIVKRLADLLGHPIRVRSCPGRGSVFSLELQWLSETGTKHYPLPPSAPHTQGAALQVMIVEDVTDGPAALERAAHATPDLIVADYNLPNGPNGLELTNMIRAAVDRRIPALILTGDTSKATLRAVADAGCALLSKPAGISALREAIVRVVTPPTGRPVIFVVDDDDEVRDAIIAVLEADGRKAVGYPSGEALLQAFHPVAGDCLLIDAALPGMSGIDILEHLRAAESGLPVIVITGQSDVPMAIRAMKLGASDFIEKPVSRTVLLASIVDALDGSRDAATITARRNAAAAQIAGLTPRQREIMTLVLAGHPNKNIAADLGISQRTVENHRASMMQRAGVASLPALARLAIAAGCGPESV